MNRPLIVPLLVLFASIAAAQQSGEFRIAGKVVNSKTSEALAHVRVVCANTRVRDLQSVVTREDGHFEFHEPAGKFNLQAARRGFIPAGYEQHEQYVVGIVTGAGLDTEHLTFKLDPEAMISGHVLDESGEPVRNANVTGFVERRDSGVSQISTLGFFQTDDQGTYEIPHLTSGTYFLSVHAQPWYAVHPFTSTNPEEPPPVVDRGLDVAYPTTYYPDATNADEASPIPVRGGDHITIDLHLAPVPALHLFFRVPQGENGSSSFPMLHSQSFDQEEMVSGNTQFVGAVVAEITGVVPGRYKIQMAAGVGQSADAEEVDIVSNGQELTKPEVHGVAHVKAKVQIVGAAELPSKLQIVFRLPSSRFGEVSQVDANGNVAFSQLNAGDYEVLLASNTVPYSVVKISGSGHDTEGHTLHIAADETADLIITAIAGQSRVEGLAAKADKPAAGAMIVLIPQDPEQHGELFRRDESDMDGTFGLLNVVPGTYTLIAIQDGWDLDWAKPSVIAAYGKHGRQITVDASRIKVPEPVEVQPK